MLHNVLLVDDGREIASWDLEKNYTTQYLQDKMEALLLDDMDDAVPGRRAAAARNLITAGALEQDGWKPLGPMDAHMQKEDSHYVLRDRLVHHFNLMQTSGRAEWINAPAGSAN